MQWGTQSKGGGGDNIFVDKAKIVDCNITYGEKKNWQTYADDISIELTLDVGKDFTPSMYIGGKFKSDDVSGLIVGCGILIIMISEELVKFLTTPEFYPSMYVIPIYVYFHMFSAIGLCGSPQLMYSKKMIYFFNLKNF